MHFQNKLMIHYLIIYFLLYVNQLINYNLLYHFLKKKMYHVLIIKKIKFIMISIYLI